jgi:hypothetical protein
VPESVRGDSGQFVRAKTPLDAAVSVPVGERLADEHLNLLAEALTRASGIEVQLIAPNCNGLYAANGLIPPKLLTLGIPPGSAIESSPGIPPGQFSPEARRPYSFSWGATGVTGREALLSLLEGSASTLSWRVNCHSLPANGKSHCWLNIGPLQTTVLGFDGRPEKRTLSYDRCTKCPPLPPPPPTGRRQP